MTTDRPASPAGEEESPGTQSSPDPSQPQRGARRPTRASAAWVATGVALLLLIVLIIFILQNLAKVEVHFLGLSGTVPLGVALLIAAVGGGVVVAIAGATRVTQLRMNARRFRRDTTH